MSINTLRPAAIALAALALVAPLPGFGQWTPQATQVLNYCLLNPNHCSISIHHITGGWSRDFHGTRLNPLASTFKLVPLIAYGQAVAEGEVNPQTLISRDQWAEFWTGQDGGALAAAWSRLGQPQNVTLDQMVRAMIRESDNATPDFLLGKLGAESMENVIARYFMLEPDHKSALHSPGYIDEPRSIGALFTSWMGTPAAPQTGATNVADYSGIDTFGYGLETDRLFASLHDPQTVQAQRNFLCVALPWAAAPPPTCIFGPQITEPVHRALTIDYFPKSNTRTYTGVMRGLLERNLLPSHVQSVVEPHLEWILSDPTRPYYGQTFRRFGYKGGSFGTGFGACAAPPNCVTVYTWTEYIETLQNAPGSSHGTQAVVTIQLHDPVVGSNALQALELGVQHFAEALTLDPAFATMVRAELPADPLLPDLIARITSLGPDRAGPTKPTMIDVLNIGTAATTRSTTLALYLSTSNKLASGAVPIHTAIIPPLGPGESAKLTFILNPGGMFLISVVDPQNLIVESDKGNNVQYEKLLALR